MTHWRIEVCLHDGVILDDNAISHRGAHLAQRFERFELLVEIAPEPLQLDLVAELLRGDLFVMGAGVDLVVRARLRVWELRRGLGRLAFVVGGDFAAMAQVSMRRWILALKATVSSWT